MTTEALKADIIKKALAEVETAASRVRGATGAKDLYETIERVLPLGVSSLKDIEAQLNDPEMPYQMVIELTERYVAGWSSCFARYLRVHNANNQLAAELDARRRAGPGRKKKS